MSDHLESLKLAVLNADFQQADDCLRKIGAGDWRAISAKAKNGEKKTATLADIKTAIRASTAISMSAELLDYRGAYSEAKDRLSSIIPVAEQAIRDLLGKKRSPSTTEDRQLLKRWVWILIQEATAEYRSARFDRAMPLYRSCESAILNGIQRKPDYNCFGTLSKIYYGIGLVCREQFEFAFAKQHFSKSMECAWQSLEQKLNSGDASALRWTEFLNARCLSLGLGFVYHIEGQPDLALPVLLSAKNLLARFNTEKVISTHVDLIYFDAKRSAYGEDPSVVDDSIKGLSKCRQRFRDLDHPLYCARANYSLSLAYSQRARQDESKPLSDRGKQDLEQAEFYARELADYGVLHSDRRAELYSTLCRSRIERKRDYLEEAERLASDAIEAGGYAHRQIFVGALIARAEARMRRGQIKLAIEDFRRAKEESGSNLRARAICILTMAGIHARTQDSKLALECLEEWKEIKPHVANAYIRRLELSAKAALGDESHDLVIKMSEDHLDPHELERRLHQFMVRWAYGRVKGDQRAAALLGISRQTLSNWKAAKEA